MRNISIFALIVASVILGSGCAAAGKITGAVTGTDCWIATVISTQEVLDHRTFLVVVGQSAEEQPDGDLKLAFETELEKVFSSQQIAFNDRIIGKLAPGQKVEPTQVLVSAQTRVMEMPTPASPDTPVRQILLDVRLADPGTARIIAEVTVAGNVGESGLSEMCMEACRALRFAAIAAPPPCM